MFTLLGRFAHIHHIPSKGSWVSMRFLSHWWDMWSDPRLWTAWGEATGSVACIAGMVDQDFLPVPVVAPGMISHKSPFLDYLSEISGLYVFKRRLLWKAFYLSRMKTTCFFYLYLLWDGHTGCFEMFKLVCARRTSPSKSYWYEKCTCERAHLVPFVWIPNPLRIMHHRRSCKQSLL